MLFATQAAGAIANARASLEALVETSPVGIMVFDARTVEPEAVEVAELVEQARITFLSGRGGHPVLIDLAPDLPRVMADEGRIVQVLNNLIANAARHSPESTPIEAGAADYIVKPFSAAELTARVGAVLRRTEGAEPFALGELAIDYEQRLVSVGGRPVELTATEYELLRARSVNAGRVVTHDALLRRVWARREDATVQAVRNFVKKLRRKLGDDPASPSFIASVRGVGYRMPKPDASSGSPTK